MAIAAIGLAVLGRGLVFRSVKNNSWGNAECLKLRLGTPAPHLTASVGHAP